MEIKEMNEEKNGGQAVHPPTEEKIKNVRDMDMNELKEMLNKIDEDLRNVRALSCKLNAQRDDLNRYIKMRRRSGRL